MRKIDTLELALRDLVQMDKSLKKFFVKHIEKIAAMPPRRHMHFGLPWYKEEVTKQARLVYDEDENAIRIVRCFTTHKEYEKWYKGYF